MIRLGGLVSQKAFGKFEMGKVISNPFATAFVNEAEGEDHEVSMGQNQLDTIIKMATELKAKMGENEKEIPAWIQDHISKAENYISQASGNYHEYGDSNESVNEEIKEKDWKTIYNVFVKFLKANTKALEIRVMMRDEAATKKAIESIISGLTNAQRSLKLESINELTQKEQRIKDGKPGNTYYVYYKGQFAVDYDMFGIGGVDRFYREKFKVRKVKGSSFNPDFIIITKIDYDRSPNHYSKLKPYVDKFWDKLQNESVNEATYNFGKEEYTKKNLTPTQIQDIAFGYVQTPITKLVGKTLGHRVNLANDLARLTGTKQLDAKSRGKEPALIMVLLKNKLVSKEEYIQMYKDLIEKHQQVIKYLRNASPEMRNTGGAARAAAKDMKGEFDI
jgi:hypothetical protein